MTDLDVVTELRPEIPLPALGSLGPARKRLLAAIAAEVAGGAARRTARQTRRTAQARTLLGRQARRAVSRSGQPAPARIRPGRDGRARWGAWRRLIVWPGSRFPGSQVARLLVSPRGAPHELPWCRQGSTLSPRTFLDAAARAALRPARRSASRPDQFLYHAIRERDRHLYQSWVDGTRTGLVRGIGGGSWAYLPGCRDGWEHLDAPVIRGGTVGRQRCTPITAYLPSLPTSAYAMRGYLERTQQVTIGDTARRGWRTCSPTSWPIDNLLGQRTYLAPRQLAAMYDFMASTPGFTVAPDAVDAVGRHGVGIRWQVSDGQAIAPGDSAMIIFNPGRTSSWASGRGPRTTYLGRAPEEVLR